MEWIARKGTVWGLIKENVFFGETSKFKLFKRVNNETFWCITHTTNMQTNLQIVIKKGASCG